MSIEAMKQVIELYDKYCYNNDYGGIEFNNKHGYKFIDAIEALRTAIQQAAVPMTDEERKLAAIDWSPCVRAAFNAGVNAAERHHGITAQCVNTTKKEGV